MTAPSPEPPAPLAGVRVLELGNYIAAPTAGRLLADFGADVVKVERPGRGDELRGWRLHGGDTSMLFRTINRNKRSIVMDLRSEVGRRTVLSMLPRVDVLIENFRPGTLERWGLGPEVLDEVNPRLVLVRVSAFGQTGPLSPRPGFAAVAEAYGGFRELVGEPDRAPVRVGVSIGDTIAGIYAAFGAVMSLFEQGRVAAVPLERRIIDVALNEAMFSVTESLVPEYSAYGVERTRTGGRMEGIAPSNAYVCADGASIVVAGNGDGIFARYMRVIERPDLAADPALATNEGRWARRDELDDAIGRWTAARPAQEALTLLDAEGIPAGPILRASELVTDPHYAARDMIQRFDVSDGARTMSDVAFPGITPVIGGRSLPVRNLGPDLGADGAAVLADYLDLDPAEAGRLAERLAGGDAASGPDAGEVAS
ncbi:CaiB/BaiF CoA transferase family protein [Agilicoccus flavus]|uniref:CaiB/BaiF CoA transferase family protein n=1 Tax=Agilicoccus flavus TaxID=2775968 RepID=UPI001CF6ADED|nr:CoA transferase [Agilicoccus flavus]